MSTENSYKQVRRVLFIILLLNFAVAFAKIVYGILSNSSSITADGYHSFSDGTSNIVGMIGIWLASKPPDDNHHYGHAKYETLATSFIGILLFVVAFRILGDAYERFRNPIAPDINIISFVIMISTLLINIWVSTYEHKKGQALNSSILIADSKNTRSDIFVTLSVIVGLLAVKFNILIVDTVLAAIIAVLIIKAGIEIIIPSIKVLTDAAMINTDKIYNLVIQHPEIIYCHKIKARGHENHILIDFHLGLDKNIRLHDAHELSHDIKDEIISTFEEIKDVTIHIEPAEEDC